jgi:uncharacterized membrane protein
MPKLGEGIKAESFATALLLCAALQVCEGILPRIPIFPWLKLGLSYAIVLPFWMRYGTRAAVFLVVGRNLLTFLLSGQPVTTFLIGTFSSSLALLATGVPLRLCVRNGILGWTGAGMLLAAAMNLIQLTAVEWAFIRHSGFYFQAAPMLAWSVVSGALVAWAGFRLYPALQRILDSERVGQVSSANSNASRFDSDLTAGEMQSVEHGENKKRLHFASACTRLLAALFLPTLMAQAGLGLLSLILIIADRNRPPSASFKLIAAAWPLFLFQAILHLGFGEGRLIAGGWFTLEGLNAFGENALRLFNALLVGPALLAAWPTRKEPWLSESSTFASLRPFSQGFAMALASAPELLGVWFRMRRHWRRALKPSEWESLLREALRVPTSTNPVRGTES